MYRSLCRIGVAGTCPAALSFAVILALTLGLGAACGGSDDASRSSREAGMQGLRFAGVDLVYALRRIAAEEDLLLVLDEIQTGPVSPDLAHFHLDIDLPRGSVEESLAYLKEQTGAFDFLISGRVLYVRSVRSLDALTSLDVKNLPAEKLEVNLDELVKWIMRTRPRSYLITKKTRGQPVYRRVQLDVAEGSSLLDVLLQFAARVESGFRIKRAGQSVTDPEGRPAVVASSVALWGPLDEPNRLPRFRSEYTTLTALASVARRTGTSIAIVDRSAIGDIRGSLDYATKTDPQSPIDEALDGLAWSGPQSNLDDYQWKWQDGVAKLTTKHFLYFLPGRDLMRDPVNAGRFEGSLAELARWINRNRTSPPKKILMGGEVIDNAPRASLEIEEGATVEDVLTLFARESGDSWIVVIVDNPTPAESAVPPHPQEWKGAYLIRLEEWLPEKTLNRRVPRATE